MRCRIVGGDAGDRGGECRNAGSGERQKRKALHARLSRTALPRLGASGAETDVEVAELLGLWFSSGTSGFLSAVIDKTDRSTCFVNSVGSRVWRDQDFLPDKRKATLTEESVAFLVPAGRGR